MRGIPSHHSRIIILELFAGCHHHHHHPSLTLSRDTAIGQRASRLAAIKLKSEHCALPALLHVPHHTGAPQGKTTFASITCCGSCSCSCVCKTTPTLCVKYLSRKCPDISLSPCRAKNTATPGCVSGPCDSRHVWLVTRVCNATW